MKLNQSDLDINEVSNIDMFGTSPFVSNLLRQDVSFLCSRTTC